VIIVCEPQCAGYLHVEVNAALLAALHAGFPDQALLFMAEVDHLRLVSERLAGHYPKIPLELRPIRIPRKDGHFFRMLQERELCRQVVRLAIQLQAEQLIFASISSYGLLALKSLLARDTPMRCSVVMHGNLEAITRRPKSLAARYFGTRRALEKSAPAGLHYIVLCRSIQEHLAQELPALIKHIIAIDHPYLLAEVVKPAPFRDGIVHFGALGTGHLRKGLDTYFRLAQEIGQNGTSCQAEFVLVGPVTDKRIVAMPAEAVRLISPQERLSREEFGRQVRGVDYAVFPYPPKRYALSASGALCDAFSYLKPVIALRSPLFEHYFERMGDIGYLCDDYEELKQTICAILQGPPQDRYTSQVDNLLAGREIFRPELVGKGLAEVLRL
jgi:hypothetical protein